MFAFGGLAGALFLAVLMVVTVWDSAGERLAYSDRKGLEDDWRKHDDSSFARDVWLYDSDTGVHTRLTGFGADDRQAVWGPDGESLTFLSLDGRDTIWLATQLPDWTTSVEQRGWGQVKQLYR